MEEEERDRGEIRSVYLCVCASVVVVVVCGEGKNIMVDGARGEREREGEGIYIIDGYRVGELVREIIRRARACRWKPHAALFKLNPVRIIIGGQAGAGKPAHSAGAFANTRRKKRSCRSWGEQRWKGEDERRRELEKERERRQV